MIGFINIIKPVGMSSAYAVGQVKKKLNITCGHMGTLDPMASGVLPIGLGKTSRLFQYLLDKDKTYIAKFKFGILTDTLDITGNITKTDNSKITESDIKNVLPKFIGDIDQVPPNYSAKCVDGKRGYDLARKGVEFTLPPKRIHVERIELVGQVSDNEFEFKIDCKGGTYIRALARDIGYAVGSLAVMSSLVRSRCGIFNLENGITVDKIKNSTKEEIERRIIASESPLNFDKIFLNKEQSTRLINGLYDDYEYCDGLYSVYNENVFFGVGKVENKKIKMKSFVW